MIFIENIKSELKFIGDYKFEEEGIVCYLSEPQLGVYLDERVNNKGTSYSTPNILASDLTKSLEDIKNAICSLVEKHPILKARIVDDEVMPFLVCDSYPSIELINDLNSIEDIQGGNYEDLIKPFDLDKSLVRFFIIDNHNSRTILYDIHHIINDATGSALIKEEFNKVLDGELDKTLDLGFVQDSYDHFESKFGLDYETAHDFYVNHFADIGEVNILEDFYGTKGIVSLPIKDIKTRVEEFSRRNNITVGSLLNAVFAYTYSRFAGSEKVYYTFTEHGRHESYAQNALGMFVRTIPLLINCKNDYVNNYLSYFSDLVLDSMANSFYPFRLIASEFNLNNNIIFEYNLDLNDVDDLQDGLVISETEHEFVGDFLFVVNDIEGGYLIKLNHSDKYSNDLCIRFVNVFKEILTQILVKEKLSDIDFVSEEDILLLDEYNQTEYEFSYSDILDAFNDNLEKYANNPLVGTHETVYTHGESAFIINELADSLKKLGVDKQDFVALFVPRSEWFLLASMGVLSIGAVYVPIDVTYPDEQILFILEDSHSNTVIVDDKTNQHISKLISDNDLDIDILDVSSIGDEGISSLNHLETVEVNEDDFACVLYTSGTTGVPKGVLITRRAVNNFVSWYVEETGFSDADVYGMHCSYVFDIHTAALYAPVITGGSLYVVPEEIRLDLKALNDFYVEHGCTHTYITSQVGKLFAESGMETTIKLLCFGGMKLGELNAPDSIGPFETYGPSENLAVSTSIFANERIHHSSIGRFISNVKGYVLDNEKRRLPIGAVGELYLAGHQLTPGYLNREEETANSFFENPFDNQEDYRYIYSTGDLVRFLSDGTLGIVGRRDSRVKVRGNRVELSEVESAIRSLEYVEDITVQIIENKGNNELVAYVVVSDDVRDDENIRDEICDYVAEHKPDYMVPSFVIQLDSIPLNVNGKVDINALPEVDFASLQKEYAPPTTFTEKEIVDAFEKVFNQDNIGIYDDFIRLGGDSLTAIKLLSYLEDYNITAADVLSLRTPFAIAANITDESSAFDLDIYSLETGCPLNESQLNVYLDIVANEKNDSYMIPFAMDISREYDVADILDALNEMFRAHPILTMCVNVDGDMPYMISKFDPLILVESNVDDDYIKEFLTKPFDLEENLSRFLIVENENNISLFAVFHHIIFDALSRITFKQNLEIILEGGDVDIDDSFLRASAFSQQVSESQGYYDAREFFEGMLIDLDDCEILLESILADGPGVCQKDLEFDLDLFESFLDKLGISENALFTSVFAYTLSRFAGSNKVLFNIVDNGRDRFHNQGAIGMFVNTLPIVANCKNQSIPDFIKSISDLVYDVMRYDYYPFRMLASEYGIDSSIIFQFIPSWFDIENNELKNAESSFGDIVGSMDDLINDLTVEIIQTEENYVLNVMHSDKYSKDMIERFMESYNLILSQMISEDNLEDINFVSNADLTVLNDLNQNSHALQYDDILDAFNDNLTKYPNNNLVSYEDTVYSYAEGAVIARRIYSSLKDLGVDLQDSVSFLVERSELYMFCVLGILSCGGVYVPIDDNLPDERIKFMIKDTDSHVVIVSDKTYDYVDSLVDDVVLLNISNILGEELAEELSDGLAEELSDGLAGEAGRPDALPIVSGDLACILYTSGSTGVPKGVKITRKSIVNVCENYVREYGLSNGDVYGLFASIGFDAASFAITSVLYAGASLSIVPDDLRLNINQLNDYFMKNNVTHTFITTQVGKLFVQSVEDTSLDVLLVGGEKLGKVESPDNYRLVDGFGPTETFAFISSICNCEKIDPSSVGYLNYNTKAYVLDDEGRRVPLGAVGELYLAGYQIAKGYLNLEEETSNAFVPNPFETDDDYDILYRTGDLVRVLPDGSLAIVGRRDSQVKIRGNRVELSEVESIIREMDYIDDVTIQVHKNQTADESDNLRGDGANNELVAYVVISNEIDDFKESICNYVRSHKPDYMIPSYVVKLDQIPLNINGKVDKRNLPQITIERHEDYVAPTNEMEKTIVEAFEKVFNQERIGIYDDFIHLGGDSLTAIKLLSYLDGYDIVAADILSLKTPYAIAKNINKVSIDFEDYSLESGCPLNEPQLNVYLDILAKNKMDSYIIPLFMEFSNEYDIDHIKCSLEKILDVHPILGMCVSDEFDVPYLIKGSKAKISIENNTDEDYIIKFLSSPFNLNDSLCRFLIVENDFGYKLFAAFHHIIFDALSVNVFKRDLTCLIEGGNLDVDDSFLKVSSFNQQIQNTKQYEEAHNFYELMLVDGDEAGLLLDDISSEGPDIKQINLDLDSNLFKSFLSNQKVSENILFTSAFAYALSRFVGSEKVLFNIIENGRDRFNNFNAIGMYVNTLPLLIDCKKQDVSSFIDNVADLVYNVMKYNYYSFRLLANEYDLNSDILFQFIPDWINDDGYEEDLSVIFNEEDLIQGVIGPISDFVVEVIQKGEDYILSVSYSDKYSGDFVLRFMESFNLILQDIISVKELSQLTFITEDDIGLLDKYNETDHSLSYDDILDVFNENLAKYPENMLVSMNDQVYSYAEGAYIADKIARNLIDLDVKPNDCVGFWTERSPSYMFSILAIMSVGAVYVPLDDKYPDGRIEFMIKDTDSKVIIVSDETFERANELMENVTLLNISEILNDDISCLSNLPVIYNDLACVLYTSGTSGRPKGVKITRKAIVSYIEFYVNYSDMNSSDVFALYASIGFDVAAIKSIFAPIYSGGSLDIIPEDIKLNINKLNEHFIEHNVTHADITTQVAKLFVNSVNNTSLKVLFTGGEKLGQIDISNDYRFVDGYGPTEACVEVLCIDKSDKIDDSSIGYLVDNVKAYVLDAEKRRVPIGAIGELYLSGYQIAEGYLNRDNETADAFLDNPFDNDENHSILYRTGDMVRFLPDGSLAIVGRQDQQIKIRGNRVELTEVESIINEIDFVENLTVQTIKNGNNNELVAYVVSSEDIDEHNLKNIVCTYVGKNKPDYMIPSHVIKLDSIPLNVNGKVDRKALPNVDIQDLVIEYAAPRNKAEKTIVEAFEKVFNKEPIGVYDDFVRLGGDSLTVIKLLSYIKDYNITVADVLSLRTPYAIANNLKEFSFDLDLYSLESGCPLNEPQLNVYLDVMANDKINAYHIPLLMKISKSYGIDEIYDALNEMFRVHPILEMCVSPEYEVPFLIKGFKPSIHFESDMDENHILDFLMEPFDVWESLSRFSIADDGENYNLCAVFHHIIFDAISENVFKRDLISILNGEDIDIDDSFLKVSAFNQQIKDTDEYIESYNFYEAMLTEIDDVNTLLNDVMSDGPGFEEADLNLDYDSFKSFLNRYGVSENVIFVSVFAYTLSRFVGSEKVLFNIVENGRDRFNNFNAIGMFVNVLPLLVDCKNRDVPSFIDYMSRLTYDVMRYDNYPFRLLANRFGLNPDIIFQYMPEWIGDNNESDGNLLINNNEPEIVNNVKNLISDLNVNVSQKGRNYYLHIGYSENYSKKFIKQFITSYKLILHEILNVENLSDINYINHSDYELFDAYNHTEHTLAYDDILDAFNDNLAKYPNNNLVSFKDNVYTFAEGAYISDKIAKQLIDFGVCLDDCVPFFTSRSELYMFACLAILSVGAVPVPIDDALPDERINFILKDSNAKVVIASDDTYVRICGFDDGSDEFEDDFVIMNISDIINSEKGTLSHLPVVYGNLAGILYTSGSTGVPKGVKITRKSVLNVSAHYTDAQGLNNDDVYALYPSIGFDAGYKSIFKVLYSGACLLIIPDEIKYDMVRLNDYFIKYDVGHVFISTQVSKIFMQSITATSLKVLSVGGEKLGEFEDPEDYLVMDDYGPTEAFAFITSISLSDKLDDSSIGSLNYNS